MYRTQARAIARFVVLLGLSYTALMLPLPLLRPTYARCFCACNETVLGSSVRGGAVRFFRAEEPSDFLDCRMILRNRNTRNTLGVTFGSGVGYVPAAFLTALLISTPVPIRRKAGAFLWGILLVHATVSLTLYLQVVSLFGSVPDIATISLSKFSQKLLAELTRLVLFAPFFSMALAIFVWIVVTFRRADFAKILEKE